MNIKRPTCEIGEICLYGKVLTFIGIHFRQWHIMNTVCNLIWFHITNSRWLRFPCRLNAIDIPIDALNPLQSWVNKTPYGTHTQWHCVPLHCGRILDTFIALLSRLINLQIGIFFKLAPLLTPPPPPMYMKAPLMRVVYTNWNRNKLCIQYW